jgi:CHASE2 domain-containing sensor protein
MKESQRAWLYRVLTAAGVVAVGYGVFTQDEADLWIQLAAAILATGGLGLAAANSSTKSDAKPCKE